MKKRYIWIVSLVVIGIILSGVGVYFYQEEQQKILAQEEKEQQRQLLESIKAHYQQQVTTIQDGDIYQLVNDKYESIGTIKPGVILALEPLDNITLEDTYFQIAATNYYISYDVVEPTDKINNTRYQNYIPFSLEITTIENSSFYDENNQELFVMTPQQTAKVIIKEQERVGIELLNQLVYVKTDAIKEQKEVEETKEKASSIASILYHFIYLDGDTSCQETICHSQQQITEHFSYLAQENYFTLTTSEVLQFIKGEINLPPKSLLITIDDGARAEKFIPFLEQYQLNATLFLVSSWYPKETFSSPYLEIASHTHNMHTTGVCPMGQGGGINCLPRDTILTDLKSSRDTLNGTVAMAYPFFEYSNYAIELVREVGFEIAFIGGQTKIKPGVDPYKVPRYTMFYNTTLASLQKILTS